MYELAQIRDELILAHMKHANGGAVKFWGRTSRVYDLDELRSEALLTLVLEAQRWRPGPGSVFAPYLLERIHWRLNDYCRSIGALGKHQYRKQRDGPLPETQIRRPILAVDTGVNPLQMLLEKESRNWEALIRRSTLTPRECWIVCLRITGMELKAIGTLMGFGQARASQVLQVAVRKLQAVVGG